MDWKQYDKLLRKQVPHDINRAAEKALTSTAWKCRQIAQNRIGRQFIERNRWTRGSVGVERARPGPLHTMESRCGSWEDYMRRQEEGHVRRSGSEYGTPVAGSAAAGQPGAPVRTRTQRPRFRMTNLTVRHKGARNRAAVIGAVNAAVKDGSRIVFIDDKDSVAGIYYVRGGKATKSGWPGKARLELLHLLSERSVRVVASPWLLPSSKLAGARTARFFVHELNRALAKRRGR